MYFPSTRSDTTHLNEASVIATPVLLSLIMCAFRKKGVLSRLLYTAWIFRLPVESVETSKMSKRLSSSKSKKAAYLTVSNFYRLYWKCSGYFIVVCIESK